MKKNHMKNQSLTIAMFIALTLGCAKMDHTILPYTETTISTSGSLKDMPFPFGAAVNSGLLRTNTNYRLLVAKEYSSLTGENAMKFATLHPAENTYDFKDADELVALAQANGQRVHGHTLNWYKSLPTWVTNFTGNTAAWENLLKTHIQTVVARYKGKVASWDVVNEAFEDSGILRNSIWVQKLGSDYIARAFQYAHDADPDALLFYNDYGQEYSVAKRTAIINLVNNLKSRGIPIHGLGLQMHTNYNRSEADIAAAINAAAATGLKVHIAELDVSMNPGNDLTLVYSKTIGELQAAKYKSIVKTYYAIPKAQQFGITTWNVTDADSWIPGEYSRPDWPLPFNASYQRKPAYQGILDGVK